jgi:predicted RND superfamily exporter protein
MMQGVGPFLAGFIERYRRRILIVALCASLLSIPIVRGLSFEESLLDLLPKNSSIVQDFSLFTKHFSLEDALVVLVGCKDPDRLIAFAEALAARLENHPLLKTIQYRIEPRREWENPYRFLFNVLSKEEINEVMERLSRAGLEKRIADLKTLFLAPTLPIDRRMITMDPLGILPILSGHLSSEGLPVDPSSGYYLSRDRTALLMILRPTRSSYEISFNEALLVSLEKIEEEVRVALGKGPEVEAGYTGSYAYALSYAQWLQKDFVILSIISMAGLIILFYLFFRKLLILPLIILCLTANIFWTLALAGLLLGYLNMISIAFAAIILGLGIDIAIHFYARFREELGRHGSRDALEVTFSTTGRAILTAVTTTAFVFFVFAFSSFKGIAGLGLLCGLGMFVNLVGMMLIFPCLLLTAVKWGWLRPEGKKGPAEKRLEPFLQRFYVSSGSKILFFALLILFPAFWLAKDVRFEQIIRALEPKDLPPAMVNKRIQEIFEKRGGRLVVLIKDRDLEMGLQKNDALKEDLERMVAAGTIYSFDSLSTLFPSKNTQRDNLRRLQGIDKQRVLSDFKDILLDEGFRVEPFRAFFENFKESGKEILSVDGEHSQWLQSLVRNYLRRDEDDYLIATYVYPVNSEDSAGLYNRLSTAEGWRQQGAVITGFFLVEKEFGRIVKRDFETLSVISLIGVLAILLFHYRGWREIFVILIPLLGAALSFLAVIQILDLSINLFNLVVIPLIFGIGVDDHVYILHRFLEGKTRGEIGRAVFRSGRAVVLTSLTTMVGFGALMASRFDGLVFLGMTALIGIGLDMVFALVVMPSLIPRIYKARIE